MKKILIMLVLVAMCGVASAQRYLELGFNAGFGFTEGVDKRLTGSFGFNLGLTIESGLGLGAFFSGFKTTREEDSRLYNQFTDCDFCFRGYYGGVYAEKILFRKSFFYFNAGAKLGFGGVNYSNHTVEKEHWDPISETHSVTYEKADKCFVMGLEPYAYLNFDFNDNFTLSAGAEYRNLLFTNLHCGGVHIAGGNDLNGIVYMVKAKFRMDF